jgi:hypothetical protein
MAEVDAFLFDELTLVARLVLMEALADPRLWDQEENLRNWIRRHLYDRLKELLFSEARLAHIHPPALPSGPRIAGLLPAGAGR